MHPPEKMNGRSKCRKCPKRRSRSKKRRSRSKANRRPELNRTGAVLNPGRCAGTNGRLVRMPPPEKPPLKRGAAGAKCLAAGAELKCDELDTCPPLDARPPPPRICACASGRIATVPSAARVRSQRIHLFYACEDQKNRTLKPVITAIREDIEN